MRRHFEREIERLKQELLMVGTLVEEAIGKAIKALLNRDERMARDVIESDVDVNERELRIEEECLKVLALYQPVASDLRFIMAVNKINNDLERMGDLAVNIAQRAAFLANEAPLDIPSEMRIFSDHVRAMVKGALDALVGNDANLALKITRLDAQADDFHGSLSRQLQKDMMATPHMIDRILALLSTSRHLERIADHATNIAEDVYYLVKGDIIRHHAREFDQRAGFPGKDA